MTKEEVYLKLINENADRQLVVAIEELSELQKEITKHLRNETNINHISEEIADVEIMLEQLKIYFGCYNKVKEWKELKLFRLEEMVNK